MTGDRFKLRFEAYANELLFHGFAFWVLPSFAVDPITASGMRLKNKGWGRTFAGVGQKLHGAAFEIVNKRSVR